MCIYHKTFLKFISSETRCMEWIYFTQLEDNYIKKFRMTRVAQTLINIKMNWLEKLFVSLLIFIIGTAEKDAHNHFYLLPLPLDFHGLLSSSL